MLGAANRDPDQFADPDRLVLDREPNRHVSFGNGAHFCLGAPLARMEGQIAIQTTVRRLPEMRLERQAPAWHENMVMRALKSLPVSF